MIYEFFYNYIFNNLLDSDGHLILLIVNNSDTTLIRIDFSFLRIFSYVTFRAAYAAMMALVLSFYFGPKLIRFLRAKKLDQPIREIGPESHFSKKGTPTMGGLLIIFSIVISTLFWCRLDNQYIWMLLFVTVGFGFLGFLDDYVKLIKKNSDGISAKAKIVGQFLISIVIVIQLYYLNVITNDDKMPLYLPFIYSPIIENLIWPLFIPLGVTVMIGSSNAVNLTDGLDGLAIGLLLFVGIAFGAMSYLAGHYNFANYLKIAFVPGASELAVFCSAFVGAGMGFLWFNSHPAQVFMGDTGSLALGGIIGTLALVIKKEFLLIIVGGIFVVEAASVIIQIFSYKFLGKRVFKMAPIHHHFEMIGWPESKVIIRFWIIGAIFALIALSTLKIQ